MPARPKSTTERGLGNTHQKERRRLLPAAYGKACEMCGEIMERPGTFPVGHEDRWRELLDLDHSIPRVLGGGGRYRIVHRRCNRRAGQALGAALRREVRLLNTRKW